MDNLDDGSGGSSRSRDRTHGGARPQPRPNLEPNVPGIWNLELRPRRLFGRERACVHQLASVCRSYGSGGTIGLHRSIDDAEAGHLRHGRRVLHARVRRVFFGKAYWAKNI